MIFRTAGRKLKGALTVGTQLRENCRGIHSQKPVVIEQRLAGLGLRDPGPESDRECHDPVYLAWSIRVSDILTH